MSILYVCATFHCIWSAGFKVLLKPLFFRGRAIPASDADLTIILRGFFFTIFFIIYFLNNISNIKQKSKQVLGNIWIPDNNLKAIQVLRNAVVGGRWSDFRETSITKMYGSTLLALRGGGWVSNIQTKTIRITLDQHHKVIYKRCTKGLDLKQNFL